MPDKYEAIEGLVDKVTGTSEDRIKEKTADMAKAVEDVAATKSVGAASAADVAAEAGAEAARKQKIGYDSIMAEAAPATDAADAAPADVADAAADASPADVTDAAADAAPADVADAAPADAADVAPADVDSAAADAAADAADAMPKSGY